MLLRCEFFLKRVSPLLVIGGTTGGWVVSPLGAWALGQLDSRTVVGPSIIQPRTDGDSNNDTEIRALFSSGGLLGTIDIECGCKGVLTSPSSRHPPILRTLPFAPHCPISYPVSFLTHFPRSSHISTTFAQVWPWSVLPSIWANTICEDAP